MLKLNQIYFEDCLIGMQKIDDQSIDMILCDLPYNTTDEHWDIIIPFESLWSNYERIIKNRGAIVLFGTQPFTSKLVLSNIKLFRYELIWEKSKGADFFHAKQRPLKIHENIIVFSKAISNFARNREPMIYNPQMVDSDIFMPSNTGRKLYGMLASYSKDKKTKSSENYDGSKRYPKSVQLFKGENNKLHPTQKPIELIEWLIKSYSNENDLILDNCMGSGTTAIACKNLNRNFLGFENDAKYWEISQKRLESWVKTK